MNASFNTSAAYVGDVCYRDDFKAQRVIVHVSADRVNFVTVHLVDCEADPICCGDSPHKRGEVDSHGPNILTARRHASKEEISFAWSQFLQVADRPFYQQDRCGRCVKRDAHQRVTDDDSP